MGHYYSILVVTIVKVWRHQRRAARVITAQVVTTVKVWRHQRCALLYYSGGHDSEGLRHQRLAAWVIQFYSGGHDLEGLETSKTCSTGHYCTGRHDSEGLDSAGFCFVLKHGQHSLLYCLSGQWRPRVSMVSFYSETRAARVIIVLKSPHTHICDPPPRNEKHVTIVRF